MIKKTVALMLILVVGAVFIMQSKQKMHVQIILGSTRQGRLSDSIAQALIESAEKRSDVALEVIDFRTYELPFLSDEITPSRRTVITDPRVSQWSQKISQGDAYIIVTPEYNAGYPGVLKNGLDSLYKEWAQKPIAFIGYSGGPSGGAAAIAQLRSVATELKMVPLVDEIKIPYSHKALQAGRFADATVTADFNKILDQLVANFIG